MYTVIFFTQWLKISAHGGVKDLNQPMWFYLIETASIINKGPTGNKCKRMYTDGKTLLIRTIYNAMDTSVILYFTSDFFDDVKLNSKQERVHVN